MSDALVDARGVKLEVGQTVVYASTGDSGRMSVARIAKLGKRVGMLHVDRNYGGTYIEDDLASYMQYTTANRVVVVDVLPFVADRMNK